MSCEECDRLQGPLHDGAIYIRVGGHNVELVCCEEAARMLIEERRSKLAEREGARL